MNKLRNGNAVFEVTQDHNVDVIVIFERENKLEELSKDEKKNTIDVEIHKEEIKEYAKDRKTLKSNPKTLYNLICRNYTESV